MAFDPDVRRGRIRREGPTPADMLAARELYDLSQGEAGELIYFTKRAWQEWESGRNPMHPALWEFFNIKGRELLKRQGTASASPVASVPG